MGSLTVRKVNPKRGYGRGDYVEDRDSLVATPRQDENQTNLGRHFHGSHHATQLALWEGGEMSAIMAR